MMRKLLFLLTVILAALSVPAGASAEQTGKAYTDVVILSTTDMHGKCWETNVLTGSAERNNMLRAASAVKHFRGVYGADNVLVIDNGDLYQGTPVSQVQLSDRAAGRSDAPLAMSVCLKEIGYHAFVLGNHEFNYPWEVMHSEYRWLEENGIPVLAANICYDGSLEGTEPGEQVFTPYVTQTISVNGHEHKIGILGLENCDIFRWDLPANYPGLQFVHPGNESFSMAEEASLYLPRMKEEGCEFIIVSYHGGLGNAEGELIVGINTENQGMRMIAETSGIDMLIAGHDHSTGYTDTFLRNRDGRDVLVVNGGGSDITHTVWRFTEDNRGRLAWELLETGNIDLTRYEADEPLLAAMQPYGIRAESYVEEAVGFASGEWDQSSEYFTRQTDTIDLISATMITVAGRRLEALAESGQREALLRAAGTDHLDVDCAMGSTATYGGYTVSPGTVSLRDIYRLYRYGNIILVLPMSGKQIRAVMEENAETRLTVRVHGGEAFMYYCNDQFTNIMFGGINFTYDMSGPAGDRVRIAGFSNGRPFDEDRVYLVAVNNYLLGNKQCGLRDYHMEDAVWTQSEDADGGTIQDAVAEYIARRTAENGGVIPEQDFPWHWGMEYFADPKELPARDGIPGAVLEEKPEEGHAYVICHEAQGSILTARDTGEGLEAAVWPPYGGALPAPLPEGALVFTAYRGGDDSFRFREKGGKWLVAGTGGRLALQEEPENESLSCWRLEDAYGGWYVINTGTGGRQALQYYEGYFKTYPLNRSAPYIFNFYEVPAE